jgi:mono/diheme cytochrome c family protein
MLSVVVYGRNNMPAFETAFETKQLKDVGSYITEVLLPD